MLNLIYLVAVLLAVAWVFGLATSYTMGGLIHVLLVLAIIAVVFRVIAGRRVAG